MKRIALATALLAVLASLAPAQEVLSYRGLVKRLTDLKRLAVLPAPGEACAQWSSYDRASVYDDVACKYVAWEANGDGDKYIREEDGQLVLAEMEGPGCIWRIWSAAPGDGHVRIFLDGAPEPAVDLPFKGYFDCANEPFTRPALVHYTASGANNYVPIPYQKSCKIVADKNWGAYYHFTYATFPEDTQVETFCRRLKPRDRQALDKANDILSNCGADPDGRRNLAKTLRVKKTVDPAKTATVADLEGRRAITAIRVRPFLPDAPADMEILRSLALRITWDDDPEPAVWAPLGDFFGTAPGTNRYRSLPLGVTEDGWWYSYWYMPFEKRGLVELVNDSPGPQTVEFEIAHTRLIKPRTDLGRFHAKWHIDAFLPPEPERWIDWPMLKTDGRGRFCGVMLHIWNPKGGWWGEGDEKFFVDLEKFPSTFGTGSEDYFGYAWGNPTLFENAYHNQTISNNNKGHVSVNRWHIGDNVPFQRSFEGCVEKYHSNERPTRYACVAYWYLAPDGTDRYLPAPLEQRLDWPHPEEYHAEGAIEGETLEVLAKSGGVAGPISLDPFEGVWSGNKQLWWHDNKPGNTLDLLVPVESDGKYQITLRLTTAPDFGIVQFYFNDEKLGEPIDGYRPQVTPAAPKIMGARTLAAGDHRLRLEIVGKNENAAPTYMAGIDYIKLDRVE